jgi:hypothetical protein
MIQHHRTLVSPTPFLSLLPLPLPCCATVPALLRHPATVIGQPRTIAPPLLRRHDSYRHLLPARRRCLLPTRCYGSRVVCLRGRLSGSIAPSHVGAPLRLAAGAPPEQKNPVQHFSVFIFSEFIDKMLVQHFWKMLKNVGPTFLENVEKIICLTLSKKCCQHFLKKILV